MMPHWICNLILYKVGLQDQHWSLMDESSSLEGFKSHQGTWVRGLCSAGKGWTRWSWKAFQTYVILGLLWVLFPNEVTQFHTFGNFHDGKNEKTEDAEVEEEGMKY